MKTEKRTVVLVKETAFGLDMVVELGESKIFPPESIKILSKPVEVEFELLEQDEETK